MRFLRHALETVLLACMMPSPSLRSVEDSVAPSDGLKWLLYGSMRQGVRQVFARDLGSGAEQQVTQLEKGHAAMWPQWQPRP